VHVSGSLTPRIVCLCVTWRATRLLDRPSLCSCGIERSCSSICPLDFLSDASWGTPFVPYAFQHPPTRLVHKTTHALQRTSIHQAAAPASTAVGYAVLASAPCLSLALVGCARARFVLASHS
jgi:hypothetical protein